MQTAREKGLKAIYGDVTDAEFLNELSLEHTQRIVCTFPWLYTGVSFEDGRNTLIQHLRQQGYRGKTIAVASSQADLQRLKKAGFDLVIQPHVQTASQIYDIVTQPKE